MTHLVKFCKKCKSMLHIDIVGDKNSYWSCRVTSTDGCKPLRVIRKRANRWRHTMYTESNRTVICTTPVTRSGNYPDGKPFSFDAQCGSTHLVSSFVEINNNP